MQTMLRVVAAAAAALPLSAQSIVTTITAASPIAVQTTVGGVIQQAFELPGPLPDSGDVSLGGSIFSPVLASVSWNTEVSESWVEVSLRNSIVVQPPPGVSADAVIPPHEFLVTFQALGTTGAYPAYVRLFRNSGLSPGQPFPTVSIDIDNNGTIDYPNLQASPLIGLMVPDLSLGKTLRVILYTPTATAGSSGTNVSLFLEPLIDAGWFQTALGCADYGGDALFEPVALFANRGVRLELSTSHPTVFVLGFQQQPIVLPPQNNAFCLLMPQPDVVLFAPSGRLDIPLPPSVRPVTFEAQGVALLPTGLAPTDAWTISAN